MKVPNLFLRPAMNHHGDRLRRRRASLLARVVPLLLVFALTSPVAGDETGVIPYQTITGIYDAFAAVKQKDKLLLSVSVVPAKRDPAGVPIVLEIQSRKAKVPLKLAASGELQDFPLTPELRKENPPVVSNQPKGSLALRATLSIKYSGRLNEKVQWYQDALNQIESAVQGHGPLASGAAPKARAVVFYFAPGAAASVTLRSASGANVLPADDLGSVRLNLQDAALLKDAHIVLSSAPKAITAD